MGDSLEAAQKSIARSDGARSAYYKSVSGQAWGNPHGYELCIDASIDDDAAADIICSYIRRTGKPVSISAQPPGQIKSIGRIKEIYLRISNHMLYSNKR